MKWYSRYLTTSSLGWTSAASNCFVNRPIVDFCVWFGGEKEREREREVAENAMEKSLEIMLWAFQRQETVEVMYY